MAAVDRSKWAVTRSMENAGHKLKRFRQSILGGKWSTECEICGAYVSVTSGGSISGTWDKCPGKPKGETDGK